MSNSWTLVSVVSLSGLYGGGVTRRLPPRSVMVPSAIFHMPRSTTPSSKSSFCAWIAHRAAPPAAPSPPCPPDAPPLDVPPPAPPLDGPPPDAPDPPELEPVAAPLPTDAPPNPPDN